MTTRFYLDTRSVKRDGTCPMKLSISHHGKSALIPLDLSIDAKNWDSVRQVVINLPNRKVLNNYLVRRKIAIDDIIMALTTEMQIKGKTITQIRDLIIARLSPDVETKTLFIDHYIAFMNRHEKKRTREIYQATLEWIKKYDRHAASLFFEDINKSWLDGFYLFMAKDSPSINARSIHLRNIRACFNDAIDEELTREYPFRKYKIKTEKTAKRSLPAEQIRDIINADVPAWKQKYVDAFALIFYLIGINVIDLCALKRENINGDRLIYKRSKSRRIYNIKIEPEAMAIINKYQGKNKLLSFDENCETYRHFASRLNEAIKSIKSGCTTYWARHSWATIAAHLDIPKETIGAALGHGDTTTTDIYIDFDTKKVDDANRRVIDYVLGIE